MWTLIYNSVERSLEDWGIESASLRLLNQSADELSLTLSATAFDSDAPFAYDAPVTLRRSGVTVFTGRVATIPRHGAADAESIHLSILGPWQELEETVFEQVWNVASSTASLSRVIMGQSVTGDRQNAAAAVSEIIDYAADCGIAIQLGSNMTALQIPFSEVREQSLASLLRRYLAWQPSAVTAFDYSTTPPTLNIVDRADADALSWTIGEQPLAEVAPITPRHDLVVPGVVIKYLTTTTIEGSPALFISTDIHPSGTNPLSRRVFKASFDLDGGSMNTIRQQQKIVVRPLPPTFTDEIFWKRKLQWLNSPGISDFTVDSNSIVFRYPWGEQQNPAFYNNELIEGTWQEWMEHLTSPVLHIVEGTVRATCSFTYTDPATEAVSKRRTMIEAHVVSTNATTGTYRKSETNYSTGEQPPSGLAAALYASMSALQYDGSVSLIEEEPLATPIRPGMVVNLLGSRSEWATMRAQIQQVDFDLQSGTTRITFGPAKHLGADDMMRLLQPTRIQVNPVNDKTRATGKSKSEDRDVEGASLVPNDAATVGATVYSQLELKTKESGYEDNLIKFDVRDAKIEILGTEDRFIKINVKDGRFQMLGRDGREVRIYLDDLTSGQNLTIRELDYCEGETPMKIKVLCTEPYTPGA